MTQPGFAVTPIIALDGGDLANVNGLQISAGDSTLLALAIHSFATGVILDTNGGNRIESSHIGTDATGTIDRGNALDGLRIDNAAGNVISGNDRHGVHITGAKTDANVVAGNLIGTNAKGDAKLTNVRDGVRIDLGAQKNMIGPGNVISGNKLNGVHIAGPGTDDNVVFGNSIGTDANGESKPLGNDEDGVFIHTRAKSNRIEDNVISENLLRGVRITGTATKGNTVTGNKIGTNTGGTAKVPNAEGGVFITRGAGPNTIGGESTGDRNIISGNTGHGVQIGEAEKNAPTGNIVAGNYIGTKSDGKNALGNTISGVSIEAGTTSNRIERGNVISGHAKHGVRITGANTSSNRVSGNLVGTDHDGDESIPNLADGVAIDSRMLRTRFNVIGTDGDGTNDMAEGNVISGNKHNGVRIFGVSANANVVAGNLIGTTIKGTAKLPNEKDGVRLEGETRFNLIGSNGDGSEGEMFEGNTISGNKLNGVRITGNDTDSNIVAGNRIGTQQDGTNPLPNEKDGVLIELKASKHWIGSDGDGSKGDANERNTISGNKHNGVPINGAGADAQIVSGNLIGTAIDGATALGNQKCGVRIEGGSNSNQISTDGKGAKIAAEGNTIAFNGMALNRKGHGVVVTAGTKNVIRRNSIFSNQGRGIDLHSKAGDDGFTINDAKGDADVGANNLQDYPVVTGVKFGGGNRTIAWELESTAKTKFLIELYSNKAPDPAGFGEGKTFLTSFTTGKTDKNGKVTFTRTFPLAKQFIFATATDPAGNTSEFSMVDTDGDALPDGWEMNGIDVNEDGTNDFILAGANANHKDLYVEVDSMVGGTPMAATLPGVVAAFAAVPNALVQNPDGKAGITLHALNGGDNAIARVAWGKGVTFVQFDIIKRAKFGTPAERVGLNKANVLAAQRLAFRYWLFADSYNGGSSSGLAEIAGNDFMVALGKWSNGKGGKNGTLSTQQSTFMHEFGHTLGLFHGGGQAGENFNFKPNYHSIMSYTWQMKRNTVGKVERELDTRLLPGPVAHAERKGTERTRRHRRSCRPLRGGRTGAEGDRSRERPRRLEPQRQGDRQGRRGGHQPDPCHQTCNTGTDKPHGPQRLVVAALLHVRGPLWRLRRWRARGGGR
jgi:parallel beta-helix repeat protein